MSDQPTMAIDDVIREFGEATNVLPRAAMQWSLDHWAEAAPRFLDIVSQDADGADRSFQIETALLFIIHLLGEKAETAAFEPLCRMLRDGPAARDALGDGITTTLAPILISTFDGDVNTLRSVIEAGDTDEFIRNAMMQTMTWLTFAGRIARAETHAYLRHLLTTLQPQGESYVWVGWAACAAILGFADLAPDVKQLFERDFIDPFSMGYEDFEDDLRQALKDPTRMTSPGAERIEPFGSAIDELSGWYGFSEQRARDEARRAERKAERELETRHADGERNPWRHIGRNDPCPCGSGRKFKKCCLGKAHLAPPPAGLAAHGGSSPLL